MKKHLLFVLLALSLFVLPACGITQSLGSASDTGKEFMTALKDGDHQASWNLCTSDIQDEIGSYENWVDFASIRNFDDFSFNSTNVENDKATLEGEATLDGDVYKIILILYKSGDDWKVAGLDFALK